MPHPRLIVEIALAAALAAAGCGGGDQPSGAQPATTPATPTTTTQAASSSSTTTATSITRAQAQTIAQRAVGGGRVTEIEQDDEDNRPVWKVKVTNGSTKRKVSIDQQTGKVLKIETDTDGND